jgi:hypothetical protein
MIKSGRFLFLVAACGLLGMLLVGVHPRAQEPEVSEPPPVSDDEIELYIKVYNSMQDDHDLNIENAIQPHKISLENFRAIERRIQSQPRLVEKVREALLEHAKQSSVLARSLATRTPPQTPSAGASPD